MDYEIVIGLEIHAELSTNTKLLCGCSAEFTQEPNIQVCQDCLAMPGTLPRLNKRAVEYAIRAGIALNCDISEYSRMDRKHYFYPDSTKAYQTTQQFMALSKNGYLDIDTDDGIKRIGITQIHLEEDAGKLIHDQYESESLVDYNRSGVPLIEIVSEPDIRSPEEGRIFLETVKSILEYIDVSDCKMQEGSLRCDVNVSVRPKGQKELGIRSEMKNLNSFRAAYRAMVYESKRHIDMIERGEPIIRETRRWDDAMGKSFPMRTKEEANDYRYFPDPEVVPMYIDREMVLRLKEEMPELPKEKIQRYIRDYGLPEYDAGVLTSTKDLAEYFEKCIDLYDNPKNISNWVMGDILRIVNDRAIEHSDIPVTPERLIELLNMVDDGVISGSIGKKVLEEMFDSEKDANQIVEEKGLKQISDEGELVNIIKKVLDDNPQSVEDYLAGKKKAMGYLIGQTMRATRGKANPQMVNSILNKELGSRSNK
ncbi:MAG: Asp-tRNA(Asn)/Glu-tRNA(Gln) amidotransferase subunit GatB [Clostridiales bacterium]|nr:Asp-tRNA(Asn)/Glu-tRNA(Gln) amidotransferase subunit GatB [Clostridiales bacterium]